MSDEAAKLLAKRERINARLRQLKGKEKRSARKTENHRKMLLGAFLQEEMRKDPAIGQWAMRKLALWLKRDEEREMFDLKPHLVTDKAENGATQPPVELPPTMALQSDAAETGARH